MPFLFSSFPTHHDHSPIGKPVAQSQARILPPPPASRTTTTQEVLTTRQAKGQALVLERSFAMSETHGRSPMRKVPSVGAPAGFVWAPHGPHAKVQLDLPSSVGAGDAAAIMDLLRSFGRIVQEELVCPPAHSC